MKTKSVIAGEYTAPPAHGPMIAEICGTTPEARGLRRKMAAYTQSEATPSLFRRALARGLLSGLVLPADPILAAAELGLHVAPTKLVELILRAHQAPSFIDFRSVFHQ